MTIASVSVGDLSILAESATKIFVNPRFKKVTVPSSHVRFYRVLPT